MDNNLKKLGVVLFGTIGFMAFFEYLGLSAGFRLFIVSLLLSYLGVVVAPAWIRGQKSATTIQGPMTEEERYEWSESLRFKLMGFSAIAGAFWGVTTLQFFGPMVAGDEPLVHILFSAIGAGLFSLLVDHSILVRQSALPAAVLFGIYSCLKVQGLDRYSFVNLCVLAVIAMMVIGFTEAMATTGQASDFWRSFFFHPLGWGRHYSIRTLVDLTAPKD